MALEMWRDLRLAVRTLRSSPMFTLTAVLSLAIGIGGTAVIFGVVDTYLIRPVPGIANPDRVVEIGRIDVDGPGPSTGEGFNTFSYPNYQDYLQRQTVFQSLAASRTGDAVGVGGRHTPSSRVRAPMSRRTTFRCWGRRWCWGGRLSLRTCRSGSAATVAVISHQLWRSQFESDADILGRTIQVNGRPFQIIGVAAEGFNGHNITVPASGCR